MDPITMMVSSIGMQFFTNHANNRKNRELQAQQREFQEAAANNEFERMRKAQVKAAKLALELECEAHQERMEEVDKNYDKVLNDFATHFTIKNWPLNVLPFIMKGESFGSLFSGTAKSINMHCILTPSNCEWFNDFFYDDLDLRVEAEMNNNWNTQSSHPIVYYGGGWNRREIKSKWHSSPSLVNLNDIDLLHATLRKIPTMVITPYFDPYLHFRVRLWGMGEDSNCPFRIDIPHGDIEATKRIFSYDYNKEEGLEPTDDFFNTTMEEFVPYITSLIGFVADKYFWSMYGIQPILPNILQSKTQLLNNIYTGRYTEVAKKLIVEKSSTTLKELKDTSTFIDAIIPIVEHTSRKELENGFVKMVQEIYLSYEGSLVPTTYETAVLFVQKEISLSAMTQWVDFNDFDDSLYIKKEEERWDMVEILEDFKRFVVDSDRFADVNVSIYVEEFDFKTFVIHVYDIDTKKILQTMNGFDYLIKTKLLKHSNNIKAIFKHEKHHQIVCRYERIDNLIEKIQDNTLIF